MEIAEGIPETFDPGLGTWDPYVGPGTQDHPSGTLHLRPGTRDP